MNLLREILGSIIRELVGLWWRDRKKPNEVTHVGANEDRQNDIRDEIDRQRRLE